MKGDKMIDKDATMEDFAYQELKNAIVTGIYPPGSQIVEVFIAQQLNMSRSPVRIAIKRLQAEGILERHQNKRIYVAIANNKRTLDTLYVREALEGLAARFAAIRRTDEDVAFLTKSVELMNRFIAENKPKELYFASVQFHKDIFHVSQNEQLEKLGVSNMEQEAVFSYRSFSQNVERASIAHAEHLKIYKCIVAKDAEGAELVARKHVHNLIDKLLEEDEKEEPSSSTLHRF